MIILWDMNLDGYFMRYELGWLFYEILYIYLYFYILRNMNDDFRPKSDRKGGNSGSTGNKHILKKISVVFLLIYFSIKNIIPKTMIFFDFF